MTMLRLKIHEQLKGLSKYNLSTEELAVMSVLAPTFSNSLKVTQRDIVKSARWLGCHPRHEKDIVANEFESTTRQVRSIINGLRIKYHVPILADRQGYWLCHDERDAKEYLNRLEIEVKATTKAHFATYAAMRSALEMKNDYLETLGLEVVPKTQEKLI